MTKIPALSGKEIVKTAVSSNQIKPEWLEGRYPSAVRRTIREYIRLQSGILDPKIVRNLESMVAQLGDIGRQALSEAGQRQYEAGKLKPTPSGFKIMERLESIEKKLDYLINELNGPRPKNGSLQLPLVAK